MKKILVVEDDPNIKEVLTIRLRAAGHQVIGAEDGLQGFLFAVREHPDLMILDISMPAGDGFSILERMRTQPELSGVPTIFITASKRHELRERARKLGAVAFFEKPYDAAELLRAVNQELARTQSSQPA